MKSSDLKYLLAYIIPISGFFSVMYSGLLSYLTVIIAFGFIPVIEQFINVDRENDSAEEEERKKSNKVFDALLFLNIPLLYTLIIFTLYYLTSFDWSGFEMVGKILCVGIIGGSAGINVAHELGHKSKRLHIIASKILLCPVLYMHFYIEHNRGHHLNVATPDDPATAKTGENIYSFWIRSVLGSYINAWKLEISRLKSQQLPLLSRHNEMILFTLLQIVYLSLIAWFFGLYGLLFAILIAIVAFLLLETINYIEHYGLLRKRNASGRYERVTVQHSWNSDHILGRIMLYELTRHSDHHYKASKEYQILKSYPESPQLPFGYPGSMILALIPPLWFYFMDTRIPDFQNNLA